MAVNTKKGLAPLSREYNQELIKELAEEGVVDRYLPGGGYLHMSEELPYVVIYRLEEHRDDNTTVRIILSEASFLIIGNKDFEGYQRLMAQLGEAMSSKFKTFMLLEIFTGEEESNKFLIKGPADKLPTTLKILKKELDLLKEKYEMLPLEEAEIYDTSQRQPEGAAPLMEIEKLKETGALLLGLEIPPFYRDEGEEYPVFFRKFKDNLILALHKAIYDFIRVQTSSGVVSYSALGRKELKDRVYEIDNKLGRIERSYSFLWLVSPANIHEVKETFFKSNYEKVLNYHYRLLPIDPDVLKRQLYNLHIEEVDDPAMSYLFREKREELNRQITMLNDRGTPNFFYNSMILYKGVDRELCEEAFRILNEVPEATKTTDDKDLIDALEFSAMARREFEYFRSQDESFKSKVHIREDVNIMMVSQGELYLPADYKMNRKEANALIQHEVGTHVLTYHNGSQQPLEQMSIGLADYDSLQEGLAVMAEFLVDGLTANRLRTLAGRVVAGKALMEGGDFIEIFRLLRIDHGFSPERAFNITSRIMQGGGFLKDIIYLQGLVQLREHLKKGGEYEPLLAGKYGLKHVPIVKELTERNILRPGALRPSYLLTEDVQKKLKLIREGLPLFKMVSQ